MADEPGDGKTTEQQPGKTFDPRPYLRRITVRGQEADYLDVKWRLAWLRTEHPDAQITTEHVTLDAATAVFRATVQIPNGGCATGYGSETRDDFADYIEKAETKSIGRALAALGYGTQFALDFDLEEETGSGPHPIADAPVERSEAPREMHPRPRIVPRHEQPEQQKQQPEEVPDSIPGAPSEADGTEQQPSATESPQAPQAPQDTQEEPTTAAETAAQPEREPFDAADYSWNEFWHWARSMGYQSRSQLAELLDLNLDDMTPREIRQRLVDYRRSQGLES